MGLVFNEENHEYLLDGKKLISVTQLMQKHDLAPDYSNVDKNVLSKKANFGKEIHKEIEEYIKHNDTGFFEETTKFIEYVEQFKINLLESEYQVNNDFVAGTIDLLFEEEKKPYIADIKTTYQVHTDSVSWQLSIYCYLLTQGIKDFYDKYKGQVFHFKDKVLNVIDINLKPYEVVQKLMDCEKKNEKFNEVVKIGEYHLEQLTALEQVYDEIDKKLKEIKDKKDKLRELIKTEMEERGLKKAENDYIRITYMDASDSESIDTDKLKLEQPKIYEKYKKVTKKKASLRITLKKT